MWLLSGPQHQGGHCNGHVAHRDHGIYNRLQSSIRGPLGMPEQAPRRRVAPILAGDVVGYSRLMQADEDDTCAALKARRKAIVPTLVEGSISRYSTGARS